MVDMMQERDGRHESGRRSITTRVVFRIGATNQVKVTHSMDTIHVTLYVLVIKISIFIVFRLGCRNFSMKDKHPVENYIRY